jgi:colicin import membrane protein
MSKPQATPTGWQPLQYDESEGSGRSLLTALGMHAALAGFLVISFAQGQTEMIEPAGVPIEAFIADLPTTRVAGKAVLPVVVPPKPQVKPKPVPVDNVTDQKPVMPTPKPPDPMAIEEQPEIDEQKVEDARRQKELDQLIEQRVQADEDAKEAEEKLNAVRIAQQKIEDEARLAAIGDEETWLEGTRQDDSLAGQYQSLIISRITDAWLRPLDAKGGIRCRLHVVQIPGGEVLSVTIDGACNVDESIKRTILEAPKLASPLPFEGFQTVFQRDLYLNFQYDGE